MSRTTISMIRKANLIFLIKTHAEDNHKTFAALTNKQSTSYYSQIINDQLKPNGKPATVGNHLARQIERSLKLPKGYMDIQHPEQKDILDQLKANAAQDKRHRDEILSNRRDNLMYLLEYHELGQGRFATKVGCSASILNLIIHAQRKPHGGIAVVSDLLAQQIEKTFDLHEGYMDREHLENDALIQQYKDKMLIKKTRPKLERDRIDPAIRENLTSIRKNNLLYLIETRTDSKQEFNKLLGSSWNYLRNIINNKLKPNGKPYVLGTHLARQVERVLLLPDGYMDIEHDAHQAVLDKIRIKDERHAEAVEKEAQLKAELNKTRANKSVLKATKAIFLTDDHTSNRNKVENTSDPLYTVRRLNLDFLINTKARTQLEVAEMIGTANSYLSQIRNCHIGKSGRTSVLGDSLARKIEKIFGLDTGYMDIEHDYSFLLKDEQRKIGKMHSDLNTALQALVEAQSTIEDKYGVSTHVIAHHLEIASQALDDLKKFKPEIS